jgi:hypothetical protein
MILATWEAEIGKTTVQGQSGKIVQETSISKITRAETGGVVQAVELLLCKHEALSSNPSPTKKNTHTYKMVSISSAQFLVLSRPITDVSCGYN